MKNFKYFLAGISLFSLPILVNAASITLEGTPDGNTAIYDVKYNPESNPTDTISLKINKTNDDLVYELKSDYGTCDKNLECTLITTTIESEATLAKLTIKNSTAESKETTITVGGTISGATKTFTLKAGQTTTKALKDTTDVSNITFSVGTLDKTFSKDVSDYTVTGIKDTINSVTVTPNCTDNCSWSLNNQEKTQSGIRVPLQTGANETEIKIYAENGNLVKTYKFNIYRGEITTSSAYLESIKIKDGVISPTFSSMVNDYTAKIKFKKNEKLNKLDITTVTEDPTAKVEIKGNENLKEGENTITITVTSSDGENKQVYTIIATLEEEKDDTKKVTTNKVAKKKNNTWLIILLSVLGLGVIITSFILIFKKKKNKNKDKDKKDNNYKDDNNNGIKETQEEENIQDESQEDNLLDMEMSDIEKENTDTLRILEKTKQELRDEPKQDVDEALDDLMKTKKLELGDLDF